MWASVRRLEVEVLAHRPGWAHESATFPHVSLYDLTINDYQACPRVLNILLSVPD